MSFQAKVYNVMIASPGDVPAERNAVRQVLADWNDVHAAKRGIVLLPVGWETHTTPAMGATPQAIINRQILENSDLLIGIFWTRIGTATEKYASGAVEEFERHIEAGKPAMLYFSSAPVVMDSIDKKQYAALNKFKESCKSRGLYQPFDSLADFRDKLTKQIQITLNGVEFSGIEEEYVIQESAIAPMPRISLEAKRLLKRAALGDGKILRITYLGGAEIATNGEGFVEEGDARSLATWDGAIRNLEEHNLIEQTSSKREFFRVTGEGYKVADLIKEE